MGNFEATAQGLGRIWVIDETPGNAHEWQSWRRSRRESAPLMFNN
jgi:hypothetical protein